MTQTSLNSYAKRKNDSSIEKIQRPLKGYRPKCFEFLCAYM